MGSAKVYDTNLIYSRIIALKASGRDMNLNEGLKYELAPIPTTIFTNNGDLRLATSKSTLKKKAQSWSHRKICTQGKCHHWWFSHIVGGSLANTRNSSTLRLQCCILRNGLNERCWRILDTWQVRRLQHQRSHTHRTGKEPIRHHQLSQSMHLPPQKSGTSCDIQQNTAGWCHRGNYVCTETTTIIIQS